MLMNGCAQKSERFVNHSTTNCQNITFNANSALSDHFYNIAEKMRYSTGVYVLENSNEALLSRAWLTQRAEHTIDVQYFIFSPDNIGLLAVDYLVRAADRGVKIRILVDDILLEASVAELTALAAHPNIAIKVYNPMLNIGKNVVEKLWNIATDFHGINQRMHNKALIELLEKAKKSVTIQSPYLVTTAFGKQLLKKLVDKGVAVKILTNSLASTDNLEAFSGYQSDRQTLVELRVQIFELKPDAKVSKELIGLYPKAANNPNGVIGLHAKSMVIDGQLTVIGTFNLDPRSANLNTEAITIMPSEKLAQQVETIMFAEMSPDNAWQVSATSNPDQQVPLTKRVRVQLRKILPKNIL